MLSGGAEGKHRNGNAAVNCQEDAMRMRRLGLLLMIMAGLPVAVPVLAAGFELSPMQDDPDFAAIAAVK